AGSRPWRRATDRARRSGHRRWNLDVARAGRALEEFLRHRAAALREGTLDRFHVRAEDRLAVAARPLVGVARPLRRSLEDRHHVAREELVALQRLFARGPVVGAEEQPAESAVAELLELADTSDDEIGGTDERRAHLHAIGERIVGATGRPSERLL